MVRVGGLMKFPVVFWLLLEERFWRANGAIVTGPCNNFSCVYIRLYS